MPVSVGNLACLSLFKSLMILFYENGKLHYRKWFNILNEMQDLTGSLEGIISIYKYMSHSIFEMSLTAAAYFRVLTIQHLTSFKYCIETQAVQCCKLLIKEPATSHTF